MEDRTISNKGILQENGKNINNNFLKVIKGSIFAMVISLILLSIYAILLTFTSLSETTMVPVIIIVSGVSILVGSSISSLKIKKQGMLNGTLVGLIYMLSFYLLSSLLISGFSLNLESIIMIIVGGVAGMIGGIIGVNI